jgi:hypothetical protein
VTSRSAPRFVRTKTSVEYEPRRCSTSVSTFESAVTGTKRCSISAGSSREVALSNSDGLFERSGLAYLVASPRLLDANCRTVEQMRLANALCRFVEKAAEP